MLGVAQVVGWRLGRDSEASSALSFHRGRAGDYPRALVFEGNRSMWEDGMELLLLLGESVVLKFIVKEKKKER